LNTHKPTPQLDIEWAIPTLTIFPIILASLFLGSANLVVYILATAAQRRECGEISTYVLSESILQLMIAFSGVATIAACSLNLEEEGPQRAPCWVQFGSLAWIPGVGAAIISVFHTCFVLDYHVIHNYGPICDNRLGKWSQVNMYSVLAGELGITVIIATVLAVWARYRYRSQPATRKF